MTTTPEQKPMMEPLMASILTAQIQQAQFAENAVHASNERTIRELKQDFVRLYKAMEHVFDKTDSATALQALDKFHYKFTTAEADLTKKEEY